MKRGIVLMNLGSPDSTSVSDVRRYLNEFLMDKRVIDMPWLSRLLLVRGIIVPFRAPKSAAAYKSIWTPDGSPLIVLTRQLEAAVQEGMHDPVTIAMRYGNPSPRQAYEELLRREPSLEEVLVIPLYPHFAMSSYETAAEYAKEQYAAGGYDFRLRVLRPYYNDPAYIDALAASIRPYLNGDSDHILFSYHGVPERHITQNDPAGTHNLLSPDTCCQPPGIQATCYRYQCLHTTRQVAEKLQLAPGRFSISFQSRLGREEWLKPYTAQRLEQMPGEGIKKLLVACPAFVSDCLETLEEIAVEGREIFLHAGGETFTMIPCLNLHPKWVEALRGYIGEPQTEEARCIST